MNSLFNDPRGERHGRIGKIYGLPPGFNAKEAGDRPRDVMKWCAQPEESRYPFNTPERTVVSWCHANEDHSLSGGTRARVLASLKEAADWWGVELPKQQVIEEQPAWSFKVAHAKGEDTYNVNSPADVRTYAEQIIKNASEYSYDTRRQVAAALLKAPAPLRTALDAAAMEGLECAAGSMMVTPLDVKAACDIRASYLEGMEQHGLGAAVRDLGSLPKGGFVEPDLLIKIAAEIDKVDRAAGLTAYYSSGELVPAEQSFGGIPYSRVKEACEDMVPLSNGATTSVRAILANRDQVDGFFLKMAGEDVSGLEPAALIRKVSEMDDIMTGAFTDLTKLVME